MSSWKCQLLCWTWKDGYHLFYAIIKGVLDERVQRNNGILGKLVELNIRDL